MKDAARQTDAAPVGALSAPGFRSGLPRLAARLRAYLATRRPATDSLMLSQRNVYILPTRAGLLFAATLVVLLVASINYQLNLGYLLTFLLAGSGAVSMLITHGTLRGLALHLKPPAPVFAGDAAALEVVLTSTGPARYGIGLGVEPGDGGSQRALSWIDVPAGGQASAHLGHRAPRRGVHPLPTLTVETRFPLGLFRAWSVWRPASTLLVWPEPERPAAPLPLPHALGPGTAAARRSDGGETEGVRAYRRGDPLKLVVWKKLAKFAGVGGELVSRDTTAAVHQQMWLDWQASGAQGTEARLSRLAAWVIAADRGGAEYGLRLPGRDIPLGQGDAHRHACLDALARWST